MRNAEADGSIQRNRGPRVPVVIQTMGSLPEWPAAKLREHDTAGTPPHPGTRAASKPWMSLPVVNKRPEPARRFATSRRRYARSAPDSRCPSRPRARSVSDIASSFVPAMPRQLRDELRGRDTSSMESDSSTRRTSATNGNGEHATTTKSRRSWRSPTTSRHSHVTVWFCAGRRLPVNC